MGRKRKLKEVGQLQTQRQKIRKADLENDSYEDNAGKPSHVQFRPDDIVLVKAKGFPVWWPGSVVTDHVNSTTIFIHCDESEFIVQHQNILPFTDSLVEKSLETLKKKNLKSSLRAFQSDINLIGIQTSEVPTVSTSEVSTVSTSEVPTVSTSEVPTVSTDIPTSEVPTVSTDIPTYEVPTVSTSEDPTVEIPTVSTDIPTPEVQTVSTVSTSEVPTDIPTSEVPTVSTVSTSEVPTVSTVSTSEVPTVSTVSTSEVPAISTSEDPTVPTVSTSEVPTVSTSEVPAISTSEVPTVSTSEVPTVSTSEVPAISTSEVPTVSTSEVPTVSTSEVPAISTSEVPTVSTDIPTSEIPTVSTSEVPTVSTSEVPTISTSEDPTVSMSEVPTVPTVSTSEVQTVSTDVSTSEVPTVSTDIPTSDVPTVSTDIPTSEVPTVSTDIPTSEVPTVSTDVSTSGVPTVSTDIPTSEVPTVSTDVSTSGVPTVSTDIPTSEAQMSHMLVSEPQLVSLVQLLEEKDFQEINEFQIMTEYNFLDNQLENQENQDPDWSLSDTISDSDDSECSEVYPMLSKNIQKKCNTPSNNVSQQEEKNENDESQLEKEPSDDESGESDLDEETVLRDVKNSKLYIKKVMKADTSKTGKKKKVDRVYNSYQFCAACGIKVSNFSQHIERNKQKHEGNKYIKEIQEEKDPKKKDRLRTLLRGRFNHEFNMTSIRRGRGEIILERRPTLSFSLKDFGPCPICFLWVGKKLMQKHQKTCPAKTKDMDTKTTSELLTTSDAICERIEPIASRKLVKEVFKKMKMDEIGKAARSDILIIQLGNQWMEKNIGNKLKRGSYTSEIVRLVGRLLLNLKTVKPLPLHPDDEESSLWDYLKPEHFDAIVEATLLVASPSAEDEDNLEHPSNAIKLGFDIKRVISGKIGLAIIQGDKKARGDAEDLLRAMTIYWATRVTKLARVLLQQRLYRKSHKLPEPDDIKKLNEYLKAAIADFDLSKTDVENFRKVGEVVSARLLLYNRRRPGELQAIGLTDYKEQKKGEDARHLVGDCTAFERKLLESQVVITVRGKTGRGVPIILPSDTIKAMDFLTDAGIRKAAGILEKNTYVFASKGEGVVRAYDALAKACNDADLMDPNTVTCTNLRKYMATITQVLDLKPNEMEWVINHMGHSLDIHKIHYRCTSDILERTQIAKILLLQDNDRVGEFRGKSLQDIQIEDLAQESSSPSLDDTSPSLDETVTSTHITPYENEPYDFKVLDISENWDQEYNPRPVKKRKAASLTREKWTTKEEEEIKKLFKKQLERKIRPTPRECVKAIAQSKANGGMIWKRKKDVLKKKLFRIVDKLNVG